MELLRKVTAEHLSAIYAAPTCGKSHTLDECLPYGYCYPGSVWITTSDYRICDTDHCIEYLVRADIARGAVHYKPDETVWDVWRASKPDYKREIERQILQLIIYGAGLKKVADLPHVVLTNLHGALSALHVARFSREKAVIQKIFKQRWEAKHANDSRAYEEPPWLSTWNVPTDATILNEGEYFTHDDLIRIMANPNKRFLGPVMWRFPK